MRHTAEWVSAPPLTTERLQLEPLQPSHADEAAEAFGDASLHTFIGGHPLPLSQLRERYQRQSAGHSPDGSQGWLNWMARARDHGNLVGTVQATLTHDDAGLVADLAWVVGVAHQGQGYAIEAATAVRHWLEHVGAQRFRANIHPANTASHRVAERLGLAPTDVEIDGEVRWALSLLTQGSIRG